MNIKCRYGDLAPECVVLVATVRALKHHGGVKKDELNIPSVSALEKGIKNLEKQIENIKEFNIPVVVAINKFITDSEEEIKFIENFCSNLGIKVSNTEVWEKGGLGGIDLANKILETIEESDSKFAPIYDINDSIKDKILKISKTIYGADNVNYAPQALKQISEIEKFNMYKLPICMAKTQYSLSDNPMLLGRPHGFDINVKEINVSNGAGFIVVQTGNIMTMPGLPKVPAANKMDIDINGKITGLF